MQSVTSSTTTMVNSLPEPSPPAVSSQPLVEDTTNLDLPAPPISPPVHSTSTSAIITNPFAGTALSLPASTTVSSTVVPSSPLFAKVNVSNSLVVDSPASHGPLIMSAQPQIEVGWFVLYLPPASATFPEGFRHIIHVNNNFKCQGISETVCIQRFGACILEAI